jgi:hypothetical protein
LSSKKTKECIMKAMVCEQILGLEVPVAREDANPPTPGAFAKNGNAKAVPAFIGKAALLN